MKVKLPSCFSDCPVEWRSFIRHLQREHYNGHDIEVRYFYINNALEKYAARMQGNTLYFETENDYMFFKLSFG